MDSDQDIAKELERLNVQLIELAAAEDIYLTACENSPSSECGPEDGQQPEPGTAATQLAGRAAVTHKQPLGNVHASSQEPAQRMLPQDSSAKQQTADGNSQQPGNLQLGAIASFSHAPQIPSRPRLQPDQTSPTVDPHKTDAPALYAPMQSSAVCLQLSSATQHQQQDVQQQQQSLLVQQLLQQHGKLLDLLQILASTKKAQRTKQHRTHKSRAALVDTSSNTSSSNGSGDVARYLAIQEQYQSQLLDNHQLKKRLSKVQKVLLQHLQEAKLKAAAAEAASEGAQRREKEALTAATALQAQVLQQQEDLQRQQLELNTVRDQLQQVRELHKQKLAQTRAELKQQYDAQLQATTAAYAQELAQIQAHLAGTRKRSSGSKHTRPSAAATAVECLRTDGAAAAQEMCAAAAATIAGSRAAREPGQLNHAAVDSSSRAPAAAESTSVVVAAAAGANPVGALPKPWTTGMVTCSAFADPQQQQRSQSQEMNVPAEVMQYAERYQQGREGTCRPPTAPPSVLQRKRQQEQPVPEAAAQLAQHFVAGGEGISRPLTAPSSDRCGLLPRRSGSPPPRSSRPSARNSVELLATGSPCTGC